MYDVYETARLFTWPKVAEQVHGSAIGARLAQFQQLIATKLVGPMYPIKVLIRYIHLAAYRQ